MAMNWISQNQSWRIIMKLLLQILKRILCLVKHRWVYKSDYQVTLYDERYCKRCWKEQYLWSSNWDMAKCWVTKKKIR